MTIPVDDAGHARPFRVMIIDDESTVRTFAARVLTLAGYAVDTAAGGADALAIVAREGTFDLFVIDVRMPEMEGVEVARQLRARHPNAKVLYFTGYADHLFDEKSVLWENEAFLEKPVSITGLQEAVSLLLFKHTLGPQLNPRTPRHSAMVPPVAADEVCATCGNLLFPRHLAPGMAIPVTADVVCPQCGRAYERTNNPARLRLVWPLVKPDEDAGD